MKKIARVFPRRTRATPDDQLAFTTPPPNHLEEIDEVHISVAFTWDIPKAEVLARQWEAVGVPIHIGGPAYNMPGGEFIPGMYLKEGFVITSRGCPNRCWFCSVPIREGYQLRELPIHNGYHVLDDNLLACSDRHIQHVFDMLKRQKQRPIFSGGLEAKLLKQWHATELYHMKTQRMYFAYDTPDDYEPLVAAGKLLKQTGFKPTNHKMCCYVLIGYPNDTFAKAEERLIKTTQAGFMPYAMLYRDESGITNQEWRKFQREWCRPMIVATKFKQYYGR